MLITLLQLSQMGMGITVTIASLVYHAHGAVCYVPAANSVLGLGMYASYFALFFALFQQLYLAKSRTVPRSPPTTLPAEPAGQATAKVAMPEAAAPFTGWAGKQAEVELVLDVGNDAVLGMCHEGSESLTAALQRNAPTPPVRRPLTAAILKPPSVNEPRLAVHAPFAWLRTLPYPRATLSSVVFNVGAVLVYVPAPNGGIGGQGGTVAPRVVQVLLHAMGLLSFLNWSVRIEASRLADVSCMLVLKLVFVAIALRIDADDAAFLTCTLSAVALSVGLIFGLRLADDGADRVMAPAIAALLLAVYSYRSPAIIERPEGLLIFVLGYVCKFCDVHHVAPRFYWWTTLFHAAVAYAMCLCGMQLRGVNAAEDYLIHLY